MERMTATEQNTRIMLLGSLAELMGRERRVALPAEGTTVAGLRERLGQIDQSFALALARPGVCASIDHVVVPDDTEVQPGQEVAFFPLVSGG